MKKMLLVLFLVIISLMSHNVLAQSTTLDTKTQETLLAAINDERHAQATYQAVINHYGKIRPFVNILEAEKRHESALLTLFQKYNLAIPENTWTPDKISIPKTLTAACEMGVMAEKANITMYDSFLNFVKESDIRIVFNNLQSASKNNHLKAFRRCARQ